ALGCIFSRSPHSSGHGFSPGFWRDAHSAGSLVLQLRGPHLSIWPWWRRRSSMAVTAALSPSSFPQSSTGRSEVTSVLARPKQRIFTAGDEGGRRQIENQASVHLLVEVEIEIVERHLRIAKLCLFAAPFQQSVAATSQFIGYQTGKEVDGGHRLRLGLLQTRFQHRRDTAETQLP